MSWSFFTSQTCRKNLRSLSTALADWLWLFSIRFPSPSSLSTWILWQIASKDFFKFSRSSVVTSNARIIFKGTFSWVAKLSKRFNLPQVPNKRPTLLSLLAAVTSWSLKHSEAAGEVAKWILERETWWTWWSRCVENGWEKCPWRRFARAEGTAWSRLQSRTSTAWRFGIATMDIEKDCKDSTSKSFGLSSREPPWTSLWWLS